MNNDKHILSLTQSSIVLNLEIQIEKLQGQSVLQGAVNMVWILLCLWQSGKSPPDLWPSGLESSSI